MVAAGYDPAGLTAAQSEVGADLPESAAPAPTPGTIDPSSTDEATVARLFVDLVGDRFRGRVKGPFHHEWREMSGMPRQWYCGDGETAVK